MRPFALEEILGTKRFLERQWESYEIKGDTFDIQWHSSATQKEQSFDNLRKSFKIQLEILNGNPSEGQWGPLQYFEILHRNPTMLEILPI